MSGSIPSAEASITITARDVEGNIIPESGGASPLKLKNHGTTTIEGSDLQASGLSIACYIFHAFIIFVIFSLS
jgi:hypothetical protein